MISTYQRLKRQRDAGEINGFTLIELLIVIVVLGILAAVVIFALGGITGKSALAACQADGATVSTAMAAYNAQNPNGPAMSQTNLTTGTSNNGNSAYIQSWPSNGSHYTYTLVPAASPAPAKLQITVGGVTADYTGPASCANVS